VGAVFDITGECSFVCLLYLLLIKNVINNSDYAASNGIFTWRLDAVDKRSPNIVYSVQLFCASVRISKYSNEIVK